MLTFWSAFGCYSYWPRRTFNAGSVNTNVLIFGMPIFVCFIHFKIQMQCTCENVSFALCMLRAHIRKCGAIEIIVIERNFLDMKNNKCA